MTTVTWLGHSAWLVESDGTRIVIDPFFTGNPAAAVSADQVRADFLVISHGHGDHVGDAASIAKRIGATCISNFEICDWLSRQGVQKTHPMNTGGSYGFPFGRLKLTIAFHTSMLPDGANGGNPVGVLLFLKDGRKLYFACDTGLFGDMRLIGEEGLDLAVVPIGDNYTMGPDDALKAVKLLQPKRVVPTHYNTWPVIAQDPDAWVARVRAETGIAADVLKPGESLTV